MVFSTRPAKKSGLASLAKFKTSGKQKEMATDVVVCRACTSNCTEYKSLDQSINGEPTTLFNLLALCAGLEMDADADKPDMPTHICDGCTDTLAIWYAFRKMVQENNEMLHTQIKVEFCDPVDGEVEYLYLDEIDAEALRQNQDYVALPVLREEEVAFDNEEDLLEEVAFNTEKEDLEEELLEVERLEIDEVEQREKVEMEDLQQLEELEPDVYEEQRDEYEDTAHEEICEESVDPVRIDIEEDEKFKVKNELEEVENDEKFTQPDLEEMVFISVQQIIEPKVLELPPPKETIKAPRKDQKTSNSANPNALCQICFKQLSSTTSLRLHMQLHAKESAFMCSTCGEEFKTYNSYKGHVTLHDANNPNKCELCDKVYRSAGMLRLHMMLHTGEKPFECEVCGVRMTQKAAVAKHMMVHTGEMPHVCDICGKKFRHIGNLNAHKKFHSEKKPFKCTECIKSFHTERQFKRHVNTHKVEFYRPHSCDKCNISYKHPSSLSKHKREVHNEYKSREAKAEKLPADKVRPKIFECTTCEKRFPRQRNLNRHMETHAKDNYRPHRCSKCPRTFKHLHSLNFHRRKVHFEYQKPIKGREPKYKPPPEVSENHANDSLPSEEFSDVIVEVI